MAATATSTYHQCVAWRRLLEAVPTISGGNERIMSDEFSRKMYFVESRMVLCPIAIAVGCKKCPIFGICPVKGIIGDYKPDEAAKNAPQDGKAKGGAFFAASSGL